MAGAGDRNDQGSAPAGPGPRPMRGFTPAFAAASATVIVILSLAGFVGWLSWGYFSDDTAQSNAVAAVGVSTGESGVGTGPAAPAAQAARAGAEAMFGYEYTGVADQLDDAAQLLTGDFRSRFEEYASSQVIPAAKERQVTVQARVVGAAPVRFGGDTASVMVFLDQVAKSGDGSKPAYTPSQVMMAMKKVDGTWLIDDVETI